jgi:hypothetical protein
MMKIGRRGSMTCRFTATGVQGHSPIRTGRRTRCRRWCAAGPAGGAAAGPGHGAFRCLDAGDHHHRLRQPGHQRDPGEGPRPRSTSASTTPIPAPACRPGCGPGGRRCRPRPGSDRAADQISGESFLTPPGELSALVRQGGAGRDGRKPVASTSGGTSDARFVKDHCPVVEFGLVGKTMHQVDERVEVAQIPAEGDLWPHPAGLFRMIDRGATSRYRHLPGAAPGGLHRRTGRQSEADEVDGLDGRRSICWLGRGRTAGRHGAASGQGRGGQDRPGLRAAAGAGHRPGRGADPGGRGGIARAPGWRG